MLTISAVPITTEAAAILVNGRFEDGPAMDGPLCSISPSTCQDVDIVAGSPSQAPYL